MSVLRNMDESYFRVYRDGKWQSICYSDLTKAEKYDVMEGKGIDWLKSMCIYLGETIRKIGDEMEIVADED